MNAKYMNQQINYTIQNEFSGSEGHGETKVFSWI